MQLTTEERDALERYRELSEKLCHNTWYLTEEEMSERSVLGYQLCGVMVFSLFPVRTYGTETIRWDDPVTPERLQACGWKFNGPKDDGYAVLQCDAHLTVVFPLEKWEIDFDDMHPLHTPRNMLEVWQLMERCGIDDKESFQ